MAGLAAPTEPPALRSAAGPSGAAHAPVRLAVGGALALAGAVGVGRFVYTPILPAMAEELGLTGAQAGLVATANVVGYMLGALLAAAPRIPGSRRGWLVGSLAASAATTCAMAGATALAELLALRFLAGAASAFALVFASALVLDRLAQAGRPGLSAVHFAGVGAGIVLSAALLNGAAGAGQDWRGLWAAAGLLCAAAIPAVRLLVPGEAPGARQGKGEDGRLRITPPFAALLAAYFLFGVGYIVIATFLMTLVRDEPALHAVEPAVWLTVGLAAVPSVAVWNRLGLRFGTFPALALALVAEAGGVALGGAAFGAPGILAAAALLGVTFMGITALGIAGARTLAPEASRPAVSVMTAIFGLGSALAPPASGFVADRFGGFGVANQAASLALVAGAVLAWAAGRASRDLLPGVDGGGQTR